MNDEAQMTNGRAAIDTLQFVIRHSDFVICKMSWSEPDWHNRST
jgi:hypothetical protein